MDESHGGPRKINDYEDEDDGGDRVRDQLNWRI